MLNMSLHNYENSFDLAEPLKGLQGPQEAPDHPLRRSHFGKNCSDLILKKAL